MNLAASRADIQADHHLLSLHLQQDLLLLLLDQLRVQLSGARGADDGRAEVADRVLSHCRQRGRLPVSLLLGATMKIERDPVYAGVQQYHRRQRNPVISHLPARHTERVFDMPFISHRFSDKKNFPTRVTETLFAM